MKKELPVELPGRGVGNTTRQMEAAPHGSVFVWCNGDLNYPCMLAEKIGREDLKIVGPEWLLNRHFAGLELSGLIADHGLIFNNDLHYAWAAASPQVRVKP